jgi:hypothetical protein
VGEGVQAKTSFWVTKLRMAMHCLVLSQARAISTASGASRWTGMRNLKVP